MLPGATNSDLLQQVQDSSDETLQTWWKCFGIKGKCRWLCEQDSCSDFFALVVSELIYRGFCFEKREGKECADRGIPITEMCSGCRAYWIGASWLAGKATGEWIIECAAQLPGRELESSL